MKMFLLLLLISTQALARPVPEFVNSRPIVLIGYFDAFGTAPFNNSTKVALEIYARTKDHPGFEIKLCELNTVFDKSFYQLEDCIHKLPSTPQLVLGLGESNCNIKIETMARNLDNTKGPDNDGVERKDEVIIPDGPSEIGFNYPLARMYCALSPKERNQLDVSNNAGSFVCNNMAYQMAYSYQDLVSGFIHVPANSCRDLPERNEITVNYLTKMISEAVKVTELTRLSTRKAELQILRDQTKNDKCLNEFYKRSKGVDEKGLWPF